MKIPLKRPFTPATGVQIPLGTPLSRKGLPDSVTLCYLQEWCFPTLFPTLRSNLSLSASLSQRFLRGHLQPKGKGYSEGVSGLASTSEAVDLLWKYRMIGVGSILSNLEVNTSNEKDRPRIIWLRQRRGGSKKSGYENEIRTSREVG
jgi:hypothetical protein